MSRIPLVTTALVTTLSFCAHYCPRTDYEAVQSWPRPGVSCCWPGLPCTQLHCTQYCTPVLYTVLYTCTVHSTVHLYYTAVWTHRAGYFSSQPPHHQCYISSTYKLLSWSSWLTWPGTAGQLLGFSFSWWLGLYKNHTLTYMTVSPCHHFSSGISFNFLCHSCPMKLLLILRIHIWGVRN